MKKLPNRLKQRLLLLLIVVYFVIGVLSGAVFYYLLPNEYFPSYPFISLFFLVSGIMLTVMMDRSSYAGQPDMLLNIYMMGRMIKFMFTVLFLLLYVIIIKNHKIVFAVSMLVNYFIYTTLELYIYYLYNKRSVKHEQKKKEDQKKDDQKE